MYSCRRRATKTMGTKFQTALFHVEYGPDILFERVHFIMGKVNELKMTKHFLKRSAERGIPLEVLDAAKNFQSANWKLISCAVRTDKGKFVKSTWEMRFHGVYYWLVVGLGDGAMTIIQKDGGSGKKGAVQEGELYEFVRRVNQSLMDEDSI